MYEEAFSVQQNTLDITHDMDVEWALIYRKHTTEHKSYLLTAHGI